MAEQGETILKAERDRFVAFAFAAADLLIEADHRDRIVFMSGAVRGLTKADQDRLSGRPVADLIAPPDRAMVSHLLDGIRKGGRLTPAQVRLQVGDGRAVIVWLGGCRIHTLEDRTFLTATMVPGASAPPAGPGGLLDQERFIEVAGDHLKAARESGIDPNLTFLVIEGLTRIRAGGGGASVDSFLDKLGAYLRAQSLGGNAAGLLDEGRFALVHGEGVDADAIRAGVQAVVDDQRGDMPLGEVTGFSINLDAGDLSEADAGRALAYSIKTFCESAGQKFTISSLREGAQSILDETLPRIEQLRETIDERAFDLVYQPIVDMNDQKVHHYEALTRLTGFGTPGEFIAFAEDVNLINEFDLCVVQRVAEILADQARSGWNPVIAVNLSGRSLQSDLFISELQRVLAPFGQWARQIMFELTETVKVNDFDQLNKVLQSLRQAGHVVCLDDVGSGTTSFESLHQLKVDFAKIDGLHVRRAAADSGHRTILKSIIDVCQEVGCEVIAEQIEEDSVAAMLRKLGIRYGQGYHYGRPVLDFRKHVTEQPPARLRMPQRRRGGAGVTTWG